MNFSEFSNALFSEYAIGEDEQPQLLNNKPTLAEIGAMVDVMSAEDFLSFLAEERIGSRRAFCDAFGIGESTLSGWSKEGRIPRSAKLVLGLFMLMSKTEEMFDRTNRALLRLAAADRIVKDGDEYLVVAFGDEVTGEAEGGPHVGQVVARGIRSVAVAERLVSYQHMLETLEAAREALAPEPAQLIENGTLIDEFVLDDPNPSVASVLQQIDHFTHSYGWSRNRVDVAENSDA